jgi:hypothetical protein
MCNLICKVKAPVYGGYHANGDIAVVDVHAVCDKTDHNSCWSRVSLENS